MLDRLKTLIEDLLIDAPKGPLKISISARCDGGVVMIVYARKSGFKDLCWGKDITGGLESGKHIDEMIVAIKDSFERAEWEVDPFCVLDSLFSRLSISLLTSLPSFSAILLMSRDSIEPIPNLIQTSGSRCAAIHPPVDVLVNEKWHNLSP